MIDQKAPREVQRLFHEALDRPQEERGRFLEEISSSDPQMAAVVEDLLRASSQLEGFLADGTPGSPDTVAIQHPGTEPPQGIDLHPAAPRIGEVIGDYQILEMIGGNMGLVFRARHRLLDKVVALKVLPVSSTADPRQVARFERELRIMGQLDHPHIVAASDARIEGRWRLVAMQLIEGPDLERLVEDRGPLPVPAACEAARQAALGLEYLHQHGLIHRDIKPSNLMLTTGGTVKVIDVGISLIRGEPEARLTRAGLMMGTATYCSPEQLRDASSVDIRADIYSLGCTLYQLLTGEPPYRGKGSLAQVVQAHLNEPFPGLLEGRSDAPPGLEEVLARMTAKNPSGRFSTPGEAASALAPFARGADLAALFSEAGSRPAQSAARTSAARPGSRRSRRGPAILAAALAAVLAIAGAAAMIGLHSRGDSRPLEVTSFQVELFSNRAGMTEPRGRMGVQAFAAEVEDDVQVSFSLSEPGYCYLLALNTDGRVQLCWPNDDQRIPEKARSMRFPVETAQGFGLTDGEGLQGFLLAASRMPLPAYARWGAKTGLPWAKTQAEGVWRFSGTEIESEGDADRGTRGQVRSLRGLEPFKEVCEALRSRDEFSSVRAIAFPVVKKK